MTRCPCGRANCWHVNIQEYCERQAKTNRAVAIAYSIVLMLVIARLVAPKRRI